MKTTYFILLMLIMSFAYGQTEVSTNSSTDPIPTDRLTLSIGLFHGGGSLAGVDLEFMATDRIGLQMGVGYVGFAQSALGSTFLFRGKKILTAQIGLGYRLRAGNIPEKFTEVPVLLLYSLGIYLNRSGFTPKTR